ncbi:sulfite exporter TauE/SafE family protein [Saccharospirillum mangrovi]|uniref:sulfite exporter TauE/SafE family protein n=1 Tax=Saccharospirillum mangrovi TaxID=2161747 RepID=UPI001300382F|nr:sulfite exporter TauE/SafE family protein [Saccharospirillum mangrovi]
MPFSSAWLISASVAFAAGTLRGYTGFGFAITMALGLLWLLPPIQVVTTVLLLDLLGALGLLANAWNRADRAVLKRLLPTMLLASALGIALMTVLPTTAARLVVTAICLIGAVATVLQRQPVMGLTSALDRTRDLRWAWPAGGASGLAMSLSSAGGPPLMVYLMRTRLTPEAARATAILFFMAASAVSLLGYVGARQITTDTLWRALSLSPLALIGAALGHWLFVRFPPLSFRTVVAPLLVLMAAWMLIREVRTLVFG